MAGAVGTPRLDALSLGLSTCKMGSVATIRRDGTIRNTQPAVSGKLVLQSRLSPEALITKIAGGIDAVAFPSLALGLRGSSPLLGRIDGREIVLRKRRAYGNSFAPFFYGSVVAHPRGSILTGTFQMHPSVRIILAIWFSMAAYIALSETFFSTRYADTHITFWNTFGPFGFLAAGGGLVWFGKLLSRNEEPFIRAFLGRCAREKTVITWGPAKPLWGLRWWSLELAVRRAFSLMSDGVPPAVGMLVISLSAHWRPPADPEFSSPLWLGLWLLYEVVTTWNYGRGLGKKFTKIMVVTSDGRDISFLRSLGRSALKVLAISPVFAMPRESFWIGWLATGLYALPSLFNAEHRMLHDWLFGTKVVLKR